VLLTALAGLIAACSLGTCEGALISVEATPISIPADGRSYSQILITVFDASGDPVPDNTEVRLTATAGDITPVVYTAGGRAFGILTSSTFPQTSVVNAYSEGTSGSAQVEFSASDYRDLSPRARTIRMEGSSLAYSVEMDTVLASGGVTMQYRGLTIEAASAQVCQMYGQIRAQGGVTVRRGDQTLTADAFAHDTGSNRISLLDYEAETMRVLEPDDLKPIGPGVMSADARLSEPLMYVQGRTWIVCERLTLIPGQRILFFGASIYVGDMKVLAIPYYSYSYEKRESILQQVRYTSRDGMLIDLPYYYRMTDTGTGALKLRYAGDGTDYGSYYRPRRGISLGLEQDYYLGDRSQGRVFVDSIADSSMAYEMAHHLEYGSVITGGRADLSARYQPSSSYARNNYNASLSMMGSLRNYDYSVFGYLGGSRNEQFDPLDPESVRYLDQSYGTIEAIFRPKRRIAAAGATLTPSLSIGYKNLWDPSGGPASAGVYQSLGLNAMRTDRINRATSLSFDGGVSLTTALDGGVGASLRLRPALRRQWNGGSASLSYTLSLQDGATDSAPALSTHQLGLNLFLSRRGKWNLFSFATYGLDTNRLTLYSSLNYRVNRLWQVRTSYNLYRYSYDFNDRLYSYENSYLKVGIYRPIGYYEVGVAWSPDGQNYGINRNRRLWLELGGRGF